MRMTGNNIALPGLVNRGSFVTQGSASLHPGLRVHRRSATLFVLVNVKGGENVSVTMIRDFAHVIDREKAAIGLFVTLAEPTRPMREEAAALGFYDEARFGTKFPKLQILTIEGLMAGTDRAEYPDLSLGQGTFKKAMVEDVGGEQERMF